MAGDVGDKGVFAHNGILADVLEILEPRLRWGPVTELIFTNDLCCVVGSGALLLVF